MSTVSMVPEQEQKLKCNFPSRQILSDQYTYMPL